LRHLEQPFLDKLSSTIRTAATQLLAFDKDLTRPRTVYVVFNFDDRIHEYAYEYQKQIEAFLAVVSLPDVESLLEIKPAFHSVVRFGLLVIWWSRDPLAPGVHVIHSIARRLRLGRSLCFRDRHRSARPK